MKEARERHSCTLPSAVPVAHSSCPGGGAAAHGEGEGSERGGGGAVAAQRRGSPLVEVAARGGVRAGRRKAGRFWALSPFPGGGNAWLWGYDL